MTLRALPGRAGRLITLALTTDLSDTLATRLPRADASRFRAIARRAGKPPGVLLRQIVLAATSSKADPADVFAVLAEALGLPEDALPQEVVQAVADLAAELPAPQAGAEALTDTAAPPLTKEQTQALTRRGLPATRAAWVRLARSAVRTPSTSEPRASAKPAVVQPLSAAEAAYCEKHKVSRADLEARKASAVKRATTK